MDEPFGSLDAITRQRLQTELNRIVEQTRVTLLFVTHSIEEAVLLGDRILILTRGPGRVRQIVDNAAVGHHDTASALTMKHQVQELLGE
jgi:ABC-type nitrate/sulfonate/bicarbonate transport system ATPase subunit